MKYAITGSKVFSRKLGKVQVWIKENENGNPVATRLAVSAKLFDSEAEARQYKKEHGLSRTYSIEAI